MGTLSETSAFVFVALLLCAPACGAPLGGTSGGLEGAAGGAAAFDQRLLAAYQNCMAARGYVVNGSTIQPAAPPAVHQSAAPAERPTVETRLTRLRELHQDGLISNKEYRERRQ